MNVYTFLSVGYDLLDKIWLLDGQKNPRRLIGKLIPNRECKVLDMCCGTFSNGLMIAEMNPLNTVVGIDRSKPMLREAKKKAARMCLKNAKLMCADATDTHMKAGCFDYIMIGLVLHECSEQLRRDILTEARRLLKSDGRLIIMEWEREESLLKRMKFAPIYALEIPVNPGYFKDFFACDKTRYFEKHGFSVENNIKCNYTTVITMTLAH
jgi:ubiquinone/menaquinone biosynthesis C-methylase UbiE